MANSDPVEPIVSTPGTPRVTVRELQPRHAEALCHLRHCAIRECPWNFGTPPTVELKRSPSYYRRQLVACRIQQGNTLIGLFVGNHLAGMAGLRLRRTRRETFGLIYSMYIEPENRGRGGGRALLRSARRRILDQWDVPKIRLDVEINNHPALRLYRSEGFLAIRTQKAAFRINGISYDVYLMEQVCDPPTANEDD